MWNVNAMMLGAASALMLLGSTPVLATPADTVTPVAITLEVAGSDVGSVWMPPRPGSYRDKFCLEDRPCKYRTQIV